MLVAAVQFCPKFRDKRVNLQTAAKLVLEAAKAGAQLVVLPELATSGYSLMTRADADIQAEPVSPGNPTMDLFRQLSEQLNVGIIWGMVERALGTGDLHNSQVFVTPDGLYTSYRKINSFGNDFLWSTPGKSNPPIRRFCGKNVGLLICRDIRDKKDSTWTDFYQKGDADLVCLSANWGKGAFPANAWMDFVKDNGCTLVVSNRYGHETPNDFGDGGICVVYPDQKVICEGLIWGQDCIVYAEV